MPEKVFESSEWYNGFLKRMDIFRNATVLIQDDEPGLMPRAHLSLFREKRQKSFSDDEVDLLARIGPHLRRSLQMQFKLQDALAERDALGAILDRLRFPVFAVDATAKIVNLNAAAKQIIDGKDGLHSINGRLAASHPNDEMRLAMTIFEAAETSQGRSMSPGGAVMISRPSLNPPLQLMVSPLTNPGTASIDMPKATALIIVSDPDAQSSVQGRDLIRLYGLTKSESNLAVKLAEGMSLTESAVELTMSRETARWHLKSIFQKTDTHRQSVLVKKLNVGVGRLVEDEGSI